MKRLIVKVKDKTKVHSLKDICEIVYVSKYINVIGVEIREESIPYLENNDNVIDIRESKSGKFSSNPQVARICKIECIGL